MVIEYAMEFAPEGMLRDRQTKGDRVPLSTIVLYVDQLASAVTQRSSPNAPGNC